MKRKQFNMLMHLLEKQSMQIDSALQFGVDLIEFVDPLYKANEILMTKTFGEEAAEMISWFIYEKDFGRRDDIKTWDENDNEICRTVDQLYDYIKSLKKKK